MSLAGHRPVLRWALRLFARDWRQQVLVVALLTFAVTAALFGSVTIANGLPSPSGEFGTANTIVRVRQDGGPRDASNYAALVAQLGATETIGHRDVPLPGTAATVDFRSQQPRGRFSAPTLALVKGRYPRARGEIALTGTAAADFHTGLDRRVDFGGSTRTVVGIVENPNKLDDEFALGLNVDVAPQSLEVLTAAKVGPGAGGVHVHGNYAFEQRGNDDKPLAAAIVLLLSCVLMMLVALVATASFAVVAHRRQRQLGMLASIGANDAQLRGVMLSNGALVGAFAAVLGAIVAALLWLGLNARLEPLLNRRLSIGDVPFWVTAATTLLAIVTATGAAWWPARAVTRVPVTEALSGRPPKPAAVRRSLVLAVVLLALGSVGLATGVNTVRGDGKPQLLIPGAVALVIGVLVLSPIAIRGASRLSGRAPLPIRLALRDLNRYSARSGAALAAIALGLGIAVTTVVVATVAKQHFDVGNLPDTQLVFKARSDFVPADSVSGLRADVDAFARTLGAQSNVYELRNLVAPTEPPMPIELSRKIDAHSYRFVSPLFVATPELLARLGVRVPSDADVVTPQTGNLAVATPQRQPPTLKIVHYGGVAYRAAPTSFITASGIAKLGFPVQTTGWLVTADHALTAAQVRAARTAADRAGLQVESRDKQASLLATRSIATAAGVLVALALLAMTIGLIRSEAGRDLQTLVAAGATTFTRRAITAATSASLALLGSLLGIGGAYLGLTAIYLDRPSDLRHVPVPELAILLFGLPVIAAAAGWLLSGREPVALARHALD